MKSSADWSYIFTGSPHHQIPPWWIIHASHHTSHAPFYVMSAARGGAMRHACLGEYFYPDWGWGNGNSSSVLFIFTPQATLPPTHRLNNDQHPMANLCHSKVHKTVVISSSEHQRGGLPHWFLSQWTLGFFFSSCLQFRRKKSSGGSLLGRQQISSENSETYSGAGAWAPILPQILPLYQHQVWDIPHTCGSI